MLHYGANCTVHVTQAWYTRGVWSCRNTIVSCRVARLDIAGLFMSAKYKPWTLCTFQIAMTSNNLQHGLISASCSLLLMASCITCSHRRSHQHGSHCHELSLTEDDRTKVAIISHKAASETTWLQPFQQVLNSTQSWLLVPATGCLNKP